MASLHLGNAGRLATLAVVVVSIWATPMAAGAQSTAPPATDVPDSEPLLMQHARIGHTATTMPDGSVLVIGGNDRRGPIALAESFDPVSRRFRPVGSLELPRSGHTATQLADGRVLVIGGASSSAEPQGTRSVEVYDPATESFSPAGTLEKARSGHTATLLDDGRVLVTGGRRKGGGTRPRGSAEIFDPSSGTSVAVGKMQMQRAWHTATPLVDGRIALLGGNVSGPDERLIEVYDPETQRFESTGELAAIAWIHEAARLPDGRLIVASGRSGTMLVAADAASSELPASRPRARGQPTVTVLDDGRAVIIGRGGDGPARVALFDPTDDTFTSADPMTLSREDHAAVLLHDGTVMVVGGVGCDQTGRASAEIWDPESMSVVAAGEERVCESSLAPRPSPRGLGTATSGGRIKMPGAAFRITIPDDWTVELADPDTDVVAAEPGTAWEALRAVAPERSMACSVSVGVAAVPLDSADGHGTGLGGVSEPTWGSDEPWRLWLPAPDEDARWASYSEFEEVRLSDGLELENDLLYVLSCSADDSWVDDADGEFVRMMRSLELLP